ncbi:MAG: hypothetical protein MK291_06090, partial [Planctomycetes bacterium]|nr:hypothetical protein [Planctomycetota bacterium]
CYGPRVSSRAPIEPGRAEILPAGLACFAAVMSQVQADSGRVTTRGVRHGLLLELLQASS